MRGVMVRGVLDFVATVLFIYALFHMPIGDLTAIQQASPLVATLLAWLILAERVGWRRVIAILAGFLGVLLIAKPGVGGLNVYALAALASMLGSAVRDVVTRRIPARVSSLVVALANALFVCVGGLVLAVFEGPEAIPLDKIAWIALSAALLVGGYIFFILALRVGDIGSTTPFRYTNILWAIILGYLIFGDVPDRYSVVGIALIVSAGLFAIYRETRAARLAQLNSQKQ
jgi:drug/metabolite transporter (DMT)-like permease